MSAGKWGIRVGVVASLITIVVFISGVPSIPDFLGFKRSVPGESARLMALIESCKYQQKQCSVGNIQPMLRAGANPNVRTDAGLPVLHLALIYDLPPETIRLLVESGADVNQVTNLGETALMQLAGSQNPHALQHTQMLIRLGCEVNAANKDGWTALMFAAYRQDIRFAQALLNAGASTEIRNKAGDSALDIANQQLQIVEREGYRDLAKKQNELVLALRRGTPLDGHLSTGSILPVGQTGEPPIPYIAKDVCPGEGCSFGTKTTQTRLQVYEREGDTSTVSFSLEPYDTYVVITGNVHVSRPGKVEVIAPVSRSGDSRPIFRPGDSVYVLTEYGEGRADIWHKGVLYQMISEFWDPSGRFVAGTQGILRMAPQSSYWVSIRTTDGRAGWVRQW